MSRNRAPLHREIAVYALDLVWVCLPSRAAQPLIHLAREVGGPNGPHARARARLLAEWERAHEEDMEGEAYGLWHPQASGSLNGSRPVPEGARLDTRPQRPHVRLPERRPV